MIAAVLIIFIICGVLISNSRNQENSKKQEEYKTIVIGDTSNSSNSDFDFTLVSVNLMRKNGFFSDKYYLEITLNVKYKWFSSAGSEHKLYASDITTSAFYSFSSSRISNSDLSYTFDNGSNNVSVYTGSSKQIVICSDYFSDSDMQLYKGKQIAIYHKGSYTGLRFNYK